MIIEIAFQCDYLPTEILKMILRNDLQNKGKYYLSDEAIEHIFDILVKRNFEKESRKEDAWKDFLNYYVDDEEWEDIE